MLRTSKHNISNITNQRKLVFLDLLFNDFKVDLNEYIKLILNEELLLKTNLSSALLPEGIIKHSKYKREIYKQASCIIRSQLKQATQRRFRIYKTVYAYFKKNNRQSSFINTKFSDLKLNKIMQSKYFTLPNLNNLSINLTNEFCDIQKGNYFNEFISLKLPYFNEKGTRAIKINIPLKQHRHSNKFKDNGFVLRNNIQIKKINNDYFINLVWEKDVVLKEKGVTLGIDTGYRKLIATSDNQVLGSDDMLQLYNEITTCKKNSKKYKRKLIERDNKLNQLVKKIDLTNVSTVVVEDLCNVKHKFKYNKKVNDKMSRWTYRPLLQRIEMICEVNGIELVKVSPAYTSQTCSLCGAIHKENRDGDLFKCIVCGYEVDADYNASINIRNKGVYSPLVISK